MGNDSSVLSDYVIEKESFSQVGFWNLYKASNHDQKPFTIFTAKLQVDQSRNKEFENSLERLKTLRHPSILKYYNSCVSDNTIYLIVECVYPLNLVLSQQTEFDVCSGLYSILSALDFLHQRAGIVHNNICKDSVFVAKNGEWKLGYFDLSSKISEISQSFIDQIQGLRFKDSIPPEDNARTLVEPKLVSQQYRDMYGYGVLVKQALNVCINSDLAHASEFLNNATKELLSNDAQSRGTAQFLLDHPFFKQPLLNIQDFLSEIALKDNKAKEDFFKQLPSMLYAIPQPIVGAKLLDTLLSRIVVLNPAAQQYLLPYILIPRTDNSPGLFDTTNYKQFVLPVVSRIFLVRDAPIRLILLQYFSQYVGLMDQTHLVQNILPELLLGIKDTSDVVVASTLRALADLVPLLGSETVIGGTRLKLFTDGIPKNFESTESKHNENHNRKSNENQIKLPSLSTLSLKPLPLPERLEPDGGEDATSSPEKSDDHWSDWEAEENEEMDNCGSLFTNQNNDQLSEIEKETKSLESFDFYDSSQVNRDHQLETEKNAVSVRLETVTDLAALEIRVKSTEEEVDYFADMQPTITSAPSAYVVSSTSSGENSKSSEPTVNFNLNAVNEDVEPDGWNWDD